MAQERVPLREGSGALSSASSNVLPTPEVPRVRVQLHPRLGEERRVALAAVLERSGVEVALSGECAATLVPIEAVGECQGPGVLVALFDGKLHAEHAALLRRERPVALLACREGEVPSAWEARALAVALGPAPLFAVASAPTAAWRVSRVEELHAIGREAADVVRAAGGRSAAAGMAADVMHELTANALLDAPVGSDGAPKYAHRRGQDVEIAPSDACRATVAVSEGKVFLSATDLFGRLRTGPVAEALAGLGGRAHLNQSGGGAGLGLRRILEQSELFMARVRPGVVSEVVCAVDLGDNRRRANGAKSLVFTEVAA